MMEHSHAGARRDKATERPMSAGARAKVVILTTYRLDEYAYTALRASAAGFMSQRNPRRGCARRRAWWPPAMGRSARRRHGCKSSDSFPNRQLNTPGVSVRRAHLPDREVLLEVAHGRSNEEIAWALFIGQGTMKPTSHTSSPNLNYASEQTVLFAYETGLVDSSTSNR
jgi:DNA-binding NarL/FixJ family response regulator